MRDGPHARRWEGAPLEELIDHIVATYHRPLPYVIAELRVLAAGAFGSDGVRRTAVDAELAELGELLLEHTAREEELVFPWLRAPSGTTAGLVVQHLEHEHVEVRRRLVALIATADAAAPSGDAVALGALLHDLAADLADHVHLENDVLFPRALAAERSRS